MAASNRLSTAGMSLMYAVETTAGNRPTEGYTRVPEVKSIPSFNDAPATLQTTTLLETEYHTNIPGLKDAGGAKEFGANLTQELITAWNTVMTKYDAAVKDGKRMWWAVVHPKLDDAVYFAGVPSPLGQNEASVDAVLETTLYITNETAFERQPKPTDLATMRSSADTPIAVKASKNNLD